MLVCSRPPGSRFSHFARVSYIASVTPLRSRMSPMRRNNGTTAMAVLLFTIQGMCA